MTDAIKEDTGSNKPRHVIKDGGGIARPLVSRFSERGFLDVILCGKGELKDVTTEVVGYSVVAQKHGHEIEWYSKCL